MTDAKEKTDGPKQKGSGAGCMAVFGSPFVMVALGLGYMVISQVGLAWQAQRHWQRVDATIEWVKLVSRRSSDGSSYRVEAAYRYEFNGRHYRRSRVDSTLGGDSSRDYHNRVYRRLKRYQGMSLGYRAYVDPDDPGSSLLVADIRWGYAAILALIAMISGSIGLWLLIGSFTARAEHRRQQQWRRQHPSEPWRWRPEWRGDTLPPDDRVELWGIGIMALLWNAVTAPVPFIIYQQLQAGDKAILVALGFPLVGLLLAGLWFRRWWRRRRVGEPRLRLAIVPARVGGELRGSVELDRVPPPGTQYQLTLSCVQFGRKAGSRGRSAETRWQADQRSTAERMAPSTDGRPRSAVPVSVAIPAGLPDSEWLNREAETVWRLWIKVEQPGAGLDSTFQVPVYEV